MKLLSFRIVYCLLISLLPAVGRRHPDNGALYYQGSRGEYWSSTQTGTTTGYDWEFYSGGVSQPSRNKADGRSVRCVK